MLSILITFSGHFVEILNNPMNEEWEEFVEFFVFEKV